MKTNLPGEMVFVVPREWDDEINSHRYDVITFTARGVWESSMLNLTKIEAKKTAGRLRLSRRKSPNWPTVKHA